ncbi:hypothetical protein DFJ77DRAFT_439532 [Powellomyces hirtus]|nr:hypothetical protein DFJ77DRAFT_439532 [Powellomyces hirtus]
MNRKAAGPGGAANPGNVGRPRGGGHRKDQHGHRDLDSREMSHGGGSHQFQQGRGKPKWGSATVPVTHGPQSQDSQSPRDSVSSENGPEQAHARAVFILSNLIGNEVSVEVGHGTIYHGIYSASPIGKELGVLLKCATKLDAKGRPGAMVKHLLIMPKDVRRISCLNPEMAVTSKQAGEREVLADTTISGHSGAVRERTLQKWAPDASSEPALGLEDGGRDIGSWDQFATNEAMFGVTSDFDEHMYTTSVNKSDPNYKRREAEAIRLAREIERGPVNNIHVAEERNMEVAANNHIDEEDRYSSVIRQPGKYVPPGARKSSVSARGEAAKETKKADIASGQGKEQKKPGAAGPKEAASQKAPAPAQEPAQNVAPSKQATAAPPAGDQRQLPHKKQPALSAAAIMKLSQKTSAANGEAGISEHKLGDPAVHVAKAFKDFSRGEKEKLGKKRHEIQKQEKLNMVEDFKTFSKTFKLKTPMPEDLQEILHKPEKESPKIPEAKPEKVKTAKDVKDVKETKDAKDPKDVKDVKEAKDVKEVKGGASSAATAPVAPAKADATPSHKKSKTDSTAPAKESEEATKSTEGSKETGDAAAKATDAAKAKPAKSTFKFNAAAAEFTPSFTPSNTAYAAQKSPPHPEKSPYSGNKRIGGKNQNYAGKQAYGKGFAKSNVSPKPYYNAPHYGGEEMYQQTMDQQQYYPYQMPPYGYRPMVGRPFVAGMPGMSMPPGATFMMPGQFAPGFVPHGQVYPPQFVPPPNGNMRMYQKGQNFTPEDNGAHYQSQPGVSSPMQAAFMRSPPQMYQPGPMMGGYPPEMMQHFQQPMMIPVPHGWAGEQMHPDNPAVIDIEEQQPPNVEPAVEE